MQATQAPQQISSKMILPFVQSTRAVLSSMAGLTTTVGKPYLKTDDALRYDVSGVIGFSGDVQGSVVISFQTATAIKIVTAFAGTELDPHSADFADAIGELANMVAGSAKKDLGVMAAITIPTVIVGSNHQTVRQSGVPCVVIPCSTAAGEFVVEVNIKISNTAAPQ